MKKQTKNEGENQNQFRITLKMLEKISKKKPKQPTTKKNLSLLFISTPMDSHKKMLPDIFIQQTQTFHSWQRQINSVDTITKRLWLFKSMNMKDVLCKKPSTCKQHCVSSVQLPKQFSGKPERSS